MKLLAITRLVLLMVVSAILLVLTSCAHDSAPRTAGATEPHPNGYFESAPALDLDEALASDSRWTRAQDSSFSIKINGQIQPRLKLDGLTGPGPRSTTGLVQYPNDWPDLSSRGRSTEPLLGDVPMVGRLFESGVRIEKSTVTIGGADEVWVIAKPAPRVNPDGTRDPIDPAELDRQMKRYATQILDRPDLLLTAMPCGGLIGVDAEREEPVIIPMPLEHTDVNASIASTIASVRVTQKYHNPYNGKIEAVYVFPLPEDAAVYDFLMTIGDRTIRGIIREREEAEQIYTEAKAQGYQASLLTQERPNIFTQKVANLEPGKSIDIDIKYFHNVSSSDGWHEFVFPMVVGPRFNPPGASDPVLATSRTAPPNRDNDATDVRYLAPNERSGHDVMINVSIDAGMPIEMVACSTHGIQTHWDGSDVAQVKLTRAEKIPNKDFVLRYKLAGGETKAGLVLHRDGNDGYFNLTLVPPAALESIPRRPIEMVFVLDTSGSMNGVPLKQAKEAAEHALKQLRPVDSFQIVRFSDNASALGSRPLVATPENIQRGVQHLRSLQSGGGTMMIEGIRASLGFPTDEDRQRYVVFLTDGYIGNETEILGEMKQRLNGARVFSFGVGSSVNRFLMERMAAMGEGAVAYIDAHEDPIPIMQAFINRAAHPAMERLKIDWGGLAVSDVFPRELPDLFVGRPVTITGRFDPKSIERLGRATIRIDGFAGAHEMTIPVQVRREMIETSNHPALAKVWARRWLAELTNRAMSDEGLARELPDRVRTVALTHGLMSAYTAFIAVDSSQRTEGRYGTTVQQAVPVPDGVRYETTVDQGG